MAEAAAALAQNPHFTRLRLRPYDSNFGFPRTLAAWAAHGTRCKTQHALSLAVQTRRYKALPHTADAMPGHDKAGSIALPALWLG